ncbi:hypothetical protein ACHAXT_007842 [Thalassiosira profunda]
MSRTNKEILTANQHLSTMVVSKQIFLLGILQGLAAVAQSRFGGRTSIHRLLGRWTFDEPCIAGPVLYEDPAEGSSLYDEDLRQFHRINGRMYEDEALTLPTTVSSDVICDVIAPEHVICNYYMIDDTAGVFSLFSGIAKLDFSGAEDESPRSRSRGSKSGKSHGSRGEQVATPVGTGRFVYQGGSDLHAGILGRVSTTYGTNLIEHDFCVQGSTYDHIIPPL